MGDILSVVPVKSVNFSLKGRKMKRYRFLLKTICFFIVFCIINQLLRFVVIDDTNSYTRVMLHELYSQDTNIDVLFLGGSHCYRTFDTRITDEYFNGNTFNAGSSNQSADGSLALLKEAVKQNKIKSVYVEVGYAMAQNAPNEYKDRTNLVGTYLISDYMRPSLNKYQFLLQASGPEYYANSFISVRRNWQALFFPGEMRRLLWKKLAEEYIDYAYPEHETERYCGKGFVADAQEIPLGGMFSTTEYQQFEDSEWSKDWQKSIKQIIKICEEENISLTFFSAPVPDFLLLASGDYDLYVQFMNSLVEGTSARYDDFNLCKTEYLSLQDNCFKDDNHLNVKGAEVFSEFFSEFYVGDLSGESIFYDSYQEKIEGLEDKVFGLIVKDDKEKHTVSLKPVTNAKETEIEYTVNYGEADSLAKHKIEEGVVYRAGETGTMEYKVYFRGVETNHIFVTYGGEE